MKKIVLTYGLIAGAIMGLMMSIMMIAYNGCMSEKDLQTGMIVGYTSMLMSLTLVFFGTKSYRDKFLGGAITFGRAFGIGILIALIASVIYVIAWMVLQHFMLPNFYTDYATHQLESMKAAGATAQEIAKAQPDIDFMKSIGDSLVMKFFFTLLEPLPVALVVTLISALILKKKPAQPAY